MALSLMPSSSSTAGGKVSLRTATGTSISLLARSMSTMPPANLSTPSTSPSGLPRFFSADRTAKLSSSPRAAHSTPCKCAIVAARGAIGIPRRAFYNGFADISMRMTQTICGAGAVCVLAVWSLYSQSPAKPKPGKPAATSAQSAVRTLDSPTAGSLVQLVDITASTGIQFEHLSSPEQRYIVESMSGGVALIDYDRDGWPDIYFTNAQSVEMALAGKKARSALFHNNHDGTFTDVTDKAGVGYPCWAMGASVGDYNNDGWPDLLVTCFGAVVLYRNNGDGTFTDVTRQAGLSNDSGWATGAAFGDYDNDGWVDLFVSHYVDLNLSNLPAFGSMKTCKYHGIDVQCGPRGLKGSPDNLYHNNGDGTFTDVSKKSGVDDPERRYGLTAIWSDFDNDGKLDLFVTNDGQANYLYQGDGAGRFVDVALASGVAANEDGLEQANMGVALGDYLHTGRMSLLLSHFDIEYAALYRNDGGTNDSGMNFSDLSIASSIARGTQGYVGWGDAFVDFDNDGGEDVFLVNGHVYPQVDRAHTATRYLEPKLLFVNQKDATFRTWRRLAGGAL